MNDLLEQIREYVDRFGWKRVADDEYVLDVKPAFSTRSLLVQEGKKSVIKTTTSIAQMLNAYDIAHILSISGGDYVRIFSAKVHHDIENLRCSLILSFDAGFSYPFEKLNTYFLAGLYEFIQKDKNLGMALLGHYLRKDSVILGGGHHYGDWYTLVKVQPNTLVHKLSRIEESSITLHDEEGNYEVKSDVFGETRDNVFLPLGSYFIGNQLIMLIPQYDKSGKKIFKPFVGIKILRVGRLQRHMRELIRRVKKQVKNGKIEPHILEWRNCSLENLAKNQANFVRFYWPFHDFINDLPRACKSELTKSIKDRISRIQPLLEDIDACVSYSNCLVDYYIKRKACLEETKDSQADSESS